MDSKEHPEQIVRRTHYSMQFACLSCRKVFKQLCEYGVTKEDRVRLCPQCGEALHRMGVAFKAPRLGDTRGWRRVAYVIQRRLVYYANHNGPYPSEMHALRNNVAKRLQDKETIGQKLARRFKRRTP